MVCLKKTVLAVLLALLIFGTSCLRPAGDGGAAVTEDNVAPDTAVSVDTEINDTEKDTQNAETEPAPAEKKTLSFIGCGDNIIYYGTWRDAASKSDGTRKYSFKHIYKNVESIISSADIAFINQETVCSQSFELESYPTFNSPVDLTHDIQEIGFDIVSLANNHMLDKGAQGLRDSYDNWNARGLTVVGAYEEKESGRYITYYEKDGINIALLAYTYGTNLSEDPAKKGLYAPYLKQSDVAGDVKEARKSSDFVIVTVHWGEEGSFTPSEEQKKYAKIMAENGADLIIGHHPHVIQPIEWLDGVDGTKTLCAYSLGNFVHEQARDYNVPGGIISLSIEKEGEGRAVIKDPAFIPTVCHFPSNFYNNTVYLLEDYTEELCNSHAVRTYYNNPISLDGLKKYVTDTISEEFLPDYLK